MATDPLFLAQLDELRERGPAPDASELKALTSPAMVIAYLVAVGREEQLDVAVIADRIESILVDVDLPASMLREAATVLRALRYPSEVTSMLSRLARRAAKAEGRKKPPPHQAHPL